MAQYEKWYFIKDGVLYEHFENDGYSALRHGLQSTDTPLCSIEEAKMRYPNELIKALDRTDSNFNIKGYSYGLCE